MIFVLNAYTGQTPLPYIDLNASTSVPLQSLGHFDDGTSTAIHIGNGGFPFGDTRHDILYVRLISEFS